MKHWLGTIVVATGLLAWISPAVAKGQASGDSFTLEQVLATALAENPSMMALRLSRGIAQANLQIAGQRQNPDFLYEGARETPHDAFTLALPLETGGKRRKRIDVAGAAAQATDAEITVAEADLRVAARRGFFALAITQLRSTISAELLSIGERARAAAEARVQAGEAARLELIQAELARARLENDLGTAIAESNTARAELNVLMGRAADANLDAVTSLDGRLDVTALTLLPQAAARTTADVALLNGRLDEARARLALTRALRVPDPIVQATLTYRAPPDFTYGWRAGASVTLPLLNRNTAAVLRDVRLVEQAQAYYSAGQRTADGRVAIARSRVRTLVEQRQRETTTLLPRSLEVVRMAEEAYRAGQIDLTALLQVMQTGRDVRLRTLDTSLALQWALADLERATGVVVP